MDRKEFLAGCACCGAALLLPQSAFADQAAPGTACNEKYDFAQRWAKRLVDILDREWDPAARPFAGKLGTRLFRGLVGAAPWQAAARRPRSDDRHAPKASWAGRGSA